MAWIFSMWIETESKEQGKAIKAHFNGHSIIANKKEYTISADISGMISVGGISQSGINSQADADEMSSIGFEFYKLLKDAPTFRYAVTGVEVDGWMEMEELQEYPEDILLIKGLVIRKDIFEKLGSPGEMVEFKPGYLWTPYEGEEWDGYC